MGGDGGVIASNRKFMRGAGTANLAGDHGESSGKKQQQYNAHEAMTTCALTKAPLHTTGTGEIAIVACPYGRLYHKEAAVQVLLRRRKMDNNQDQIVDELGAHVRKLSDLYNVRFHRETEAQVTTCPITGKALQGIIPAILLVPGKLDTPNVVSEGALQQLSQDELQAEYGPIQLKVRLAPPPTVWKEMQEALVTLREEQQRTKKDKKPKKRKQEKEATTATISNRPNKAPKAQAQVTTVHVAVQSNSVLSSLFTTKKAVSEKQHKDSLFASGFA
jgi:hypothetical protein